MAIRNILRDEDPSLKKKSRAVTEFDKRLHQLLDDMRETLIEANGLGLAAPQVGVLRRAALIVDLNIETDLLDEQIIELVNPEITASSGTQSGSEGCLSVPGIYGIVTRPDLVKVKAQDRHGKPIEIWCKDITARAACHEIDHLNGVLFTTHVERFLTEEELALLNNEDDEEDIAE
ncbi:MAG: peptide deformylase [Oscillospiraceae bacterium]|nr:peptide deformylase [Oscillospiraceae bacterium]